MRVLCAGVILRRSRGEWRLRYRAAGVTHTAWARQPRDLWVLMRHLEEPIGVALERARHQFARADLMRVVP